MSNNLVGELEAQTKRPRGRKGVFVGLTVLIGFFVALLGGTYWDSSQVDLTPSNPLAITEADGRTLAVVGYSHKGSRGIIQSVLQPMFQTRIVAIDIETGEQVWNVRLNNDLINDPMVLAADRGLVYIVNDEGLQIRSVTDGALVAAPRNIGGVGDRYVAAANAYDVDTQREVIVMVDSAGEIWQVSFGSIDAVPTPDADAMLWKQVFENQVAWLRTTHPVDPDSDIAVLRETTGTIEPRILVEAIPGPPVPGQHGGRFDRGPDDAAAGRVAGYVVIVSQSKPDSLSGVAQTMNRETGEVLDTVEIARVASLTGASTLADTTVMAAEASDGTAVFIVANAAGILASYQFGETNFFGWSR